MIGAFANLDLRLWASGGGATGLTCVGYAQYGVGIRDAGSVYVDGIVS